ncbi:MAG: winged helix-turn-helix domain-containing protein [Nitrosospira sp.]|nr:winged helix-turn-helix domain-containing protein [Nitrosospira sp.]
MNRIAPVSDKVPEKEAREAWWLRDGEAVIRRAATPDERYPDPDALQVGQLTISPNWHEARVNRRRLRLTTAQFDVLLQLARRPGWVFSRAQLIEALRGRRVVTDHAINVYIFRIRKQLGSDGGVIETVRQVGYRLRSDAVNADNEQ